MSGRTAVDGAEEVMRLCARIAAETDVPGTITRLFLTPAAAAVHDLLRAEMESLGMRVRVDAAGNLRGTYPARTEAARVLLLGSHVDTVPDGGAYDGVLGVAVPLAVLRALGGERLSYAVEVIAFSEEEGVRFRLPFIGSRALVETLTEVELARTDAAGISVEGALREFGLDPGEMAQAVLTPGTFAFVEVHLDQGPVLEAMGLPLGVVSAIVGQTRLELTFSGRANHAGTTPMGLRQDALAAAAAWIVEVERMARATEGLLATVGAISVSPGAANVIAGSAVVSLDVRHAQDSLRDRAVEELVAAAARLGGERGVTVMSRETSRQAAVAMSDGLCRRLEAAVQEPHRMISGAGHDAMILAGCVPAAMLFVRTPAGLSHHPDERVEAADVAAAIDAMLRLLKDLDAMEGDLL